MTDFSNPLFDLKNFKTYTFDQKNISSNQYEIKNSEIDRYESDYGYSRIYKQLLFNLEFLQHPNKILVLYKTQKIDKSDILNKLYELLNLSYINNLYFSIDINLLIAHISKFCTYVDSYIQNIESKIYVNIKSDFLNYDTSRLSYKYTYFTSNSIAENNIKRIEIYLDDKYLISDTCYYDNNNKKYEIYFNPETTKICTILYNQSGHKEYIRSYVNGISDGLDITYKNNNIYIITDHKHINNKKYENYIILENGKIITIDFSNFEDVFEIRMSLDKYIGLKTLTFGTVIDSKTCTLLLEWNTNFVLETITNHIFYTKDKTDYESENTLELKWRNQQKIKTVSQYINNYLDNVIYYDFNNTVENIVYYKK